MSLYNELNYTSKIRDIKGVQFSIMSPEEIKKRSVVHVTQTVLWDANGEPIVGGLMDPRMGVIDNGKICPTDEQDNRFCPGYFGHIELARPVFWTQHIDIVIKILKCVCIRCSKLLVDINDPEISDILSRLKGKKRWKYMFDRCSKIKICGAENGECGCGALQPTTIKKEGFARLYAEWKEKSIDECCSEEEKKHLLTPEFVLKSFKRITDSDCEALGFKSNWCRPNWLICSTLPVPPPPVRPSVKQFNNQRSEDDITHKLIDIIKTNNHLKKKLDSEKSLENTIDEWTQVLQYHVSTLIDNEIPGVNSSTHRSGRPLKTLRQRLKGKEGRIRGNLMGKRVDFSARSVITPDPNINIDELGVPYKVAMNLTFPDIVTPYNINKLTQYVKNGPYKHPGAKSIKRKIDNVTTSLQYVDTDSIELKVGDVVNRHLIDGDTVLFNRQPSLHKMSMMAHKVRVMDYSTFRLNVTVTTPYNADFDGDEMNMHVPQSIQTSVELQYLAAVPLQIISPSQHVPIITLVQDSLLGLNRLTDDNVYLTKSDIMNILIYIKSFDGVLPEPEIKEPVEKWSGRQLVSIILPKGIEMNMKNKSHNDTDIDVLNFVKIDNGIIKQGRFDNSIMNKGSRGLIHMIHNDYGHKEAQLFLDNLQNIVTRYLVKTGFSVGISDLIANTDTVSKIEETLISKKKDVSKLVQQIHQNIFDSNTDNVSGEFETKVNQLLNKAINEAGKIGLKSLDRNNRMINMVSAGSKGKEINIAQMVACLGQQNVDGKRIPNGFNNRTLPHFSKFDVSPESKGFVENSFIKGLNPTEFFFHAMGGREGLIDTAVKTADTGYLQRKLIKAMEDLKISSDLSVRNASGTILQFLYGEDGMHYGKIETQGLDLLRLSYSELESGHKFSDKEQWTNYLTKNTITQMKKTKGWKNKLNEYFNTIIENQDFLREGVFKNYLDTNIHYPINLYRLLNMVKSLFNIVGSNIVDLNPIYVIESINSLVSDCNVNSFIKGNKMFEILLMSYLSPKKLITEHKINKVAFDYIINTIKLKFNTSKVQPSEMVGTIAAQSIGEPATQMTLNTFHYAGVSSKSNVIRGVPRLKELLHISKSIKAPSVTIFTNNDIKHDKNKTETLLNSIELTTLNDITKSVRIYYDPDDKNTIIEDDKELIDIYKIYNEIDPVMNDCEGSNLIIRFEFDKQILMEKNITMEMIYHRIYTNYKDDVSCIYSDDNSDKLIFRVRIMKMKKNVSDRLNDINILKNIEKNMREKLIIKGINNIKNVTMREQNTSFVKVGDSFKQNKEWILDTDGINLREILNYSGVDATKTYSNDIYEMYEIFGIEAAKKILLTELRDVIDDAGNYVNYRHLSLLCDTMTNRGSLMSIDRFGINRGNIGPLAKCSFEETTDQLFKASMFGETDKLTGVSSNIMMGQIPPCGTGETDVILDETKLLDIEDINESFQDIENWDEDIDYCDENIGISFDPTHLESDNYENIPEIKVQ
jgi:DNA-directed RNA polymerase II subunit RPB1